MSLSKLRDSNRSATRPALVIVGAGRSGSTLIHEMLCAHDTAAFPTRVANRFPANLALHRAVMAIDRPIMARNFLETFRKPSEAYDFWEYHCRGFRRPFRDLTASDLTERSRRRVQKALSELVTRRRNRPILKVTGWPRIDYFDKFLPECRFLHVVRDGRAVTNSLLATDWWRGWQGPNQWRWGPLSDQNSRIWNTYDQSFIALAALQWNIILEAIDAGKKHIDKDRFCEIRYEDLCHDRNDCIKNIMDFAQLPYSRQFENIVATWKISSTNMKWQSDLTAQQVETINEICRHNLERHEYFP